MKKTRRAISPRMVEVVHTLHENAVWEVGKLWDKMSRKNYARRKQLVDTAVSLVKIGKTIDVIKRNYKYE